VPARVPMSKGRSLPHRNVRGFLDYFVKGSISEVFFFMFLSHKLFVVTEMLARALIGY
jgi:hypothetical protein